MLTSISQSHRENTLTAIEDDKVNSGETKGGPQAMQRDGSETLGIQDDLESVSRENPAEILLPKTCFKPRGMATVLPKGKRLLVPTVDLSRMATVQEACQDSRESDWRLLESISLCLTATIPGLPPLLERSMSVPTAFSLRRLSEEPNQSTPKASEFPKTPLPQLAQAEPQVASVGPKLTKRSSSLLARELTPLIIPSAIPHDPRQEQSASLQSAEEHVALPPKVPPKSPRTESRASPRSAKVQHSAQSSVSTSYSSASSATSSINVARRASPRLLNGLRRTVSPVSRSGPRSAVDNVSPQSIWSKIFRLESPSRQEKAVEPAEKQHLHRPEPSPDPCATPLRHQRFASEASALPRGRLIRKDSLAFRNHSKTSLRSPSSGKREADLPTGFKAAEAPRQVAEVELRSLRQQADERVSHFEVLQAKDVAMLSKVWHLEFSAECR